MNTTLFGFLPHPNGHGSYHNGAYQGDNLRQTQSEAQVCGNCTNWNDTTRFCKAPLPMWVDQTLYMLKANADAEDCEAYEQK